MESDPELDAIRARLRQEMAQAAAASASESQPPAQEALDHPVDVDDATLPAFVREHDFVVVDVWAPWCGPCRIVGPIVDQLAREMRGQVAVAKVNADDSPGVMQAFGIQGIPTLLLFQDGRLVDRVTGALPKPQLAQWLDRHHARLAGAPGPRR